MNRAELFKLAEKCGKKKGEKSSEKVLAKLQKELEAYFKTPAGDNCLKKSPPVFNYGAIDESGNVGYSKRTDKQAIKELLELIEAEH